MKLRMIRLAAVAVVLPAAAVLFSLHARGQDEADRTWRVDPVHSSVVFKIKHFNVAYFYGTFEQIDGRITTGAEPSFAFTIPVASIYTRNEQRDNHLRSADFFDAQQFPDITFTSTAVQTEGDDLIVTGDLTLHGVTRPIEARITRTGQGADPRGTLRVGYHTQFAIQRSDFGMAHMLQALGDEVTLTVSVEAIAE